MKTHIILFAGLLIIGSCKKDPPIEKKMNTILPGSFFPVYPGSSWTYIKNDNITLTYNTSATYQKHSYMIMDSTVISQSVWPYKHIITYSDTVLVPFYNGPPVFGNTAIYGYDKIECSYYPAEPKKCERWPVLSETIGFQYEKGQRDLRLPNQTPKYTVTSRKLNANGAEVLYIEANGIPGYSWHVERMEFTKDIGLTFYYRYNAFDQDTIFKYRLLSYYINK